ncbi:ATP-dependent Clp protease ATP-binding subunit, partial [Candidatus Dojkabacteria bacterium]
GQAIDDLLEFNTLAKLKTNNPSAYQLWQAIDGSEESYFISNRFLIDKSFYEHFLDQTEGSANAIWPIAEEYRQRYNLRGYTNSALLVSLIKSVPNADQVLRSIQTELKDVETALPWMEDVLTKRKLAREKQFMGGIGRDWAYGYTPILQRLGYNVSHDIEMHGFFSDTSMHHRIVGQMMQMINNGNGTVMLVGEAGVGKTTCVHSFAEVILTDPNTPKNILHNQVVQLDAPTLLSQAKNPGQLEELMIRIFNEAHSAKNIILFFDDAEAFFGSGPSSIDLSHVLQPAIEASSVKLILAMSPSGWQRLAGSSVAGKLQPLNVPPADEENTLAVLRDSISVAEYKNKCVFTYQALREGYKLGSRYVTNLAMPGAALTVLEQTASTASGGLITKETVQASIEQTYGIKLQATSETETSQLLNLESELHKYVINQTRAVQVVSDALRRARSGVGNPNRPIGTFLFLGPKGVGKTELSKALARVYFGSEDALIRADMNQFVTEGDVRRLIEPMQGSELGFLGQVRKQPFSVILLDEIEKAHTSVVNALLQMLDEGEMRDSDNKAVWFRDAIIIATSNAGADKIREIIASGEDIDNKEDEFVETLISRGLFAPEFVNRFDEVVIFKPLTQDELVSVVDIIIAGINQSLDAQKVQVELTDTAKRWLVEKGYDSKLGARPMRRMAQRYVENTIAKKLLSRSVASGEKILLDISDFKQQ